MMERSGLHKDESEEMFKTLTRCLNLFVIGFLMYADVGGMTIKNTTMVFLFMLANSLASWPVRDVALHCSVSPQYYVLPGWVFLAWAFLVLEMKYSDRGSARERESLNV